MLFSMSGMFLLLTLIFTPEMIINITTGGMKDTRDYADAMWTLGNLGFSAENCLSQYTGLIERPRKVSCLVGNITNSQMEYGIIPSNTSAPGLKSSAPPEYIGNYTTARDA